MSFFDHVTSAPPDAIFGLTTAFNADPRTHKVNLTVGYYRNKDLKTPLLESVRKAELHLAEKGRNREYLPFNGDREFVKKCGELIFGGTFWDKNSSRIYGAQTVGGTGGLRLGSDFLKQEAEGAICISDPTWPNHRGVFARSGLKVMTYPYYDMKKQMLDFEKMYDFLLQLPAKSIVLLQASCHNPTGADLDFKQWEKLSELFLSKNLIPFFDAAYQGLGRGLEEDVAAVRLFAEAGHEMLVAYSSAKNFSIYSERAGALFLVTKEDKISSAAGSRIGANVRTTYSNPPLHGAAIVAHILGNPELRKEWEIEVAQMRERIIEMRQAFTAALVSKSRKRDYHFIKERAGMFSYTGLEKHQVEKMITNFAVYMTPDGRMNIAGLNWDNLDYVVDAMVSVE